MYKLYWAPATAALAPHAVLEELGAAYELVAVDLRGGEHRTPAYLAFNPGGYVPTLVTGEGQVLTESAAIVLALCDRHPEAGLLPVPGDPDRARLYRWLFYLTNTVQGTYKYYYYPARYSTEPADAPRIKAKARGDLIARWRPVDEYLAKEGPYLLGERYSAGDIYLAMLATWFEPKQELFASFAGIKRCFDLVAERPAVRRVLEAHGEL